MDKPRKKGQKGPDTSWHDAFLERLADIGVVAYAVQGLNVRRRTAYEHREKFPEFAKRWDEALDAATEKLEIECTHRARDYSDLLMIFLLKAHKPEKYRETRRYEVTGPGGGPVELATPQERAKKLAALLEKATNGDDDSDDD
jgi:hypothetical protein